MMMAPSVGRLDARGRQVLVSQARRAPASWVDGLAAHLRGRGIGVRRAFDGPESIRIVETGAIDLAVLSADLPRMDGLSVLRIIRSINQSLPCVFVAKCPTRRLLEQALALRAFSVLPAPVDTAILTELVERMFRKFYDDEFDGQGRLRTDR